MREEPVAYEGKNPDVVTSAYWRDRVRKCGGDLQRAIFEGDADAFGRRHAEDMRAIKAAGIKPTDSILDVGCGYGRLLSLLPGDWRGAYTGIDVSEELVELARILHGGRPGVRFVCLDASPRLPYRDNEFDVAVSVWFRSMILREVGEEYWSRVDREMRRVARRVVNV